MLSYFFLFFSTSMENILQSLVKIIIIGILSTTTSVHCNGQFLPPPLPYYPNGNFFIPSFVPPYQEPPPIYYREENPPPPISLQNSYTPPQLFHRNENYNPLQLTNPAPVRYSPPQIYPYKPQPYKNQPSFSFKKPSAESSQQNRPTEAPKKKPAFYATNIIIKEESQLPYYSDDYTKNYHDEDYSDNYSDESPPKPDPCGLNSPYRYFEPPKPDLNNPNEQDKYTLCNPYFQPNFGNSLYTVKMPITLLPSRFPPRIEQLIERIQNYFSTYTEQETPKPQNQTLTTVPPQSTSLESEEEVIVTTESLPQKNTTDFEQTNVNLTEPEGSEQVTQKTIVAIIHEEETPPSATPDVQEEKEAQVVSQSAPIPIESTAAVATTTEAYVALQGEFPVSEQQPKAVLDSQLQVEVSHNQSLPVTEMQMMDGNGLNSTTESVGMGNRTEEVFTLKDGLLKFNVTHSYS